MGGNLENVAGYGHLSLSQAVHIAQNSDGGVDQGLAQYLERRLAEVWAKLNAQPKSYVLAADEFALLNYYRPRFGDNVVVKDATKRFWDNHKVPQFTSALFVTPPQLLLQSPAFTTPASNESSPLECLQVAHPITIPSAACQQIIMVHTFAASYGQPFIGKYSPPECQYNRVIFNLTVTSAGRQFDRLALMFFDDVEIFRTSTAEPTQNGIVWSYVKDMSSYLVMFKQPRKLIFDLGNLVDDTYTGVWHTTLTATFFASENLLEPADIIIPVSARKSFVDSPSHFTVPESRAVNALKIPQNARKAVFSISACGQAEEEFWWSNVLTSDTDRFGAENKLNGHSPFRELQLIIDDQLAGVAWPFPVIFTGGVVPGFWRPVVGIDAFDLLEDEIDMTPFLPALTDDREHTFEIRVVGIEDDGNGHSELTSSIESNWIVTGKLFIWLDSDIGVVTGSHPTIHSSDPSIDVFSKTTKTSQANTALLEYSVQVSRSIHISSVLQTSKGLEKATWTQNLAYFHYGTLTNKGNDQILHQNTSGLHTSANSRYRKAFAYPLWVASTYDASQRGLTIDAKMKRGKNVEQIGELALYNEWKAVAPDSLFRGNKITNWQNGTASYMNIPSERRSYGSGSTEQHYLLSGIWDDDVTPIQHDQVLYQRSIVAVNGSVLADEDTVDGKRTGGTSYGSTQDSMHDNNLDDFTMKGVRALRAGGPH